MNWKGLIKWASLGGAVVGSTVYILGKEKKGFPVGAPAKIPDGVKSIVLTTVVEGITILNEMFNSYFQYTCAATGFNLYSAYQSPGRSLEGIPIFHVTPIWHLALQLDPQATTNKFEQDPFYASLWINLRDGKKQKSITGYLQKGNQLEFRICNVGGGTGGVETGEKITTPTVLENFELID